MAGSTARQVLRLAEDDGFAAALPLQLQRVGYRRGSGEVSRVLLPAGKHRINRLGWLYTSDSPVTWIFESLARRAKHRAVLVPTEDGADLLKFSGPREESDRGRQSGVWDFECRQSDAPRHPRTERGWRGPPKVFGPREESDCGRQWGVWDFEC